MTKPYRRLPALESLQDGGIEILYDFSEIQDAIKESINTGFFLCFFLFDHDIEVCVSAVKEVIPAAPGKDRREGEIVLRDKRVIKLYEIMAVCRYEEDEE